MIKFSFWCNNFLPRVFLKFPTWIAWGSTFCSETFNFSFMCSRIDGFGSHLTSTLYFYFSYRGGVDSEGRPVMVVVGAHFLLRCLDLERFVLYVVKVIRLWLSL